MGALARGHDVQRKRKRDWASSSAKTEVSMRMCPMIRNRKKGFSKDGSYTEVAVNRDASYDEVTLEAAEILDLSEGEEEDELTLFRVDGTIIPNRPIGDVPWSVRRYLSTLGSTGTQLKFGVGYKYKLPISKEKVKSKLAKSASTVSEKEPNGKKAETSVPPNLSVDVKYAADIASQGLEADNPQSREKTFEELQDMNEMQGDIDLPFPYLPENHNYRVLSITIGGKNVLGYDEGTFKVEGGMATGDFHVVHQSPEEVQLSRAAVAVPLYCVASGHSLSYRYQWGHAGGILDGNTPVMWVATLGKYHCTVSSGVMNLQCRSSVITVVESTCDSDVQITKFEPASASTSTDTLDASTLSTSTLSASPKGPLVDGSVMVFTEADISTATDEFATTKVIGKGGFGKVYKGRLRHADVAIKVLSAQGLTVLRAQTSSQLQTEVSTLTRFRHPNLVTLMGFCTKPPALVYPYIPRGSLYCNLHEWKVEKALTFPQRASIMRDVACGLAYLHCGAKPLVHQDINSSNILLDHSFQAKVADFGFAIQLPEQLQGNKRLVTALDGILPGTSGYRPPEYGDGHYGTLSDVYSYGIVALECYTGQLAYSTNRLANNLIDHTEEDRTNEESFHRTKDEKGGECPPDFTATFFAVVNKCAKRVSGLRPDIAQVLTLWETLLLK